MKKAFLLLMLLPLGLTFCGSGEQQVTSSEQQVAIPEQQAVVTSFQIYLASQVALAADNFSAAGTALAEFARESSGDLKALAEEAPQAEDIESMRAAFIPLSEQVAKLDLPEGYVVAFCPMANNSQGANWVQEDGAIRNPYFGSVMLDCGAIVR